jgi:hypothetical protein
MIAGWYEGFGALTGAAKARPEIYSIGCRTAAASSRYPLSFSIDTRANEAEFGKETILLEGDCRILSHIVRPTAEFMEAYYATKTVCEEKGWTLSFDSDSGDMQIKVGSRIIKARLVSEGVICWRASMEACKRARARTWPKGFIESVLEASSACRCVISSENGYPDLDFKSYQLLGTMDRDEVGFHIQAISEALDRMDELSILALNGKA